MIRGSRFLTLLAVSHALLNFNLLLEEGVIDSELLDGRDLGADLARLDKIVDRYEDEIEDEILRNPKAFLELLDSVLNMPAEGDELVADSNRISLN